mgnify:CR=1 FL=1
MKKITPERSSEKLLLSNGNSYLMQLNISTAAAGNSNVKLKFNWDGNGAGNSHYYWTIDDISISTLPDHDFGLF